LTLPQVLVNAFPFSGFNPSAGPQPDYLPVYHSDHYIWRWVRRVSDKVFVPCCVLRHHFFAAVILPPLRAAVFKCITSTSRLAQEWLWLLRWAPFDPASPFPGCSSTRNFFHEKQQQTYARFLFSITILTRSLLRLPDHFPIFFAVIILSHGKSYLSPERANLRKALLPPPPPRPPRPLESFNELRQTSAKIVEFPRSDEFHDVNIRTLTSPPPLS